jgi:hypothetical protein
MRISAASFGNGVCERPWYERDQSSGASPASAPAPVAASTSGAPAAASAPDDGTLSGGAPLAPSSSASMSRSAGTPLAARTAGLTAAAAAAGRASAYVRRSEGADMRTLARGSACSSARLAMFSSVVVTSGQKGLTESEGGAGVSRALACLGAQRSPSVLVLDRHVGRPRTWWKVLETDAYLVFGTSQLLHFAPIKQWGPPWTLWVMAIGKLLRGASAVLAC